VTIGDGDVDNNALQAGLRVGLSLLSQSDVTTIIRPNSGRSPVKRNVFVGDARNTEIICKEDCFSINTELERDRSRSIRVDLERCGWFTREQRSAVLTRAESGERVLIIATDIQGTVSTNLMENCLIQYAESS
jgi:hypothetical protein